MFERQYQVFDPLFAEVHPEQEHAVSPVSQHEQQKRAEQIGVSEHVLN